MLGCVLDILSHYQGIGAPSSETPVRDRSREETVLLAQMLAKLNEAGITEAQITPQNKFGEGILRGDVNMVTLKAAALDAKPELTSQETKKSGSKDFVDMECLHVLSASAGHAAGGGHPHCSGPR